MTASHALRFTEPFNGPIEIGLRAVVILCEAYPQAMSLQRLIIFDYLMVHSDDLPDGPPGLHPKTPHRSGELLVRRQVLQDGLALFQSRGLAAQLYTGDGVFFSATESSAAFLDVLCSPYAHELRQRAVWLQATLGKVTDADLEALAKQHINDWGAEFAMEAVLWAEDSK